VDPATRARWLSAISSRVVRATLHQGWLELEESKGSFVKRWLVLSSGKLEVYSGLGCIVALRHRPATLYQIHEHAFGGPASDAAMRPGPRSTQRRAAAATTASPSSSSTRWWCGRSRRASARCAASTDSSSDSSTDTQLTQGAECAFRLDIEDSPKARPSGQRPVCKASLAPTHVRARCGERHPNYPWHTSQVVVGRFKKPWCAGTVSKMVLDPGSEGNKEIWLGFLTCAAAAAAVVGTEIRKLKLPAAAFVAEEEATSELALEAIGELPPPN
jgi:hypothetical protein